MSANTRLSVFFVGLLGLALAQDAPLTRSQLTIDRNDTEIRVVQNGRSDQGAEFIPSNPGCEEGQSLGVVYAPPPGFVETVVNDTRIVSTVALLRRPDEAEDEETLELFDGSLELDPATLCPTNVQRTEETITVTEGRTTTTGRTFFYNNATGIGDMDGPINLERVEEGDSPALTASSRDLAFNVDSDLTTLQGNVEVASDGRTSRSERLELDEETGFAVLTGSPATSRNEEGVVSGELIEYDLDSNDVVVRGEGSVRASLDIDLGDAEPQPLDVGAPGVTGGSQDIGEDLGEDLGEDGNEDDDENGIGADDPLEDPDDAF